MELITERLQSAQRALLAGKALGVDSSFFAKVHLDLALIAARKLPGTTPRNRALRAHIVTAIEALDHVA